MKNKKIISVVLVVFLLFSVVGILFTTGVRGQPYTGSIYTTDEEGGAKDDFLEGDYLFFTIELDQNEEATLTVTLRDDDDTPRESRTITTDDSGFYMSSEENEYFDLTDRRAGIYYLRLSYEGDEIGRNYLEIHSNYASGSEIETWEDADLTVRTGYFVEGQPTYFSGIIRDARDEPLENSLITVQWVGEDDVHSSVFPVTDGDGYFEGEFDWDLWWMPDAPEPGNYLIEVVYDYEGGFEEQVIATTAVEVYEQGFTQNSHLMTTESDYETPKDFFTEGETIYYRLELIDQHGKSPAENTMVQMYIEFEGEEQEIHMRNVGTDGILEDWFQTPAEEGNYELLAYDHPTGDNVYATDSFTVISMDISIYPTRPLYTQGQTIEIRIESNYPDDIDVGITNSTTAPYRHMSGALWEEQTFTNNMWTAEYIIPIDEADGEYSIVVNRSADGQIINWMSFNIKRYALEAGTDKAVYLPGEYVDVHYRVTNYLDGSEATGVDVEWMVRYLDEDFEINSFDGTAEDGFFRFQLPDDARVYQSFGIWIWANDTAEGYEDELFFMRDVGHVEVELSTDRYTYLQGQNVYIDIRTYARTGWTRSATGPIEVELSLFRDGEEVSGFTSTIITDEFGRYSHYITLPTNIEPGLYHIRGNATWDEQWDVSEREFEVVDETQRLIVHLERDKGNNSYYPGENVNVSYWITRADRIVTDANVRYRVYSQEGTYEYGFATGGSIIFQVPEDFNPNLDLSLEVIATLDQEIEGTKTITIPVSLGRILLNPSEWHYRAGDNISFEYELVGITEGEVDLVEYEILNRYYDVIARGTPVDNTFDFTVPERPSSFYNVRVSIVTTGGYRLRQTETIRKIEGFRVELSIETPSDYTTNVYRPGDEVTIRYKLVAEDGEVLPDYVVVSYGIGDAFDAYGEFSTTETEGTFTLELPEKEDGVLTLFVSVNGNYDTQTIEVENEPSWMNRRVMGGLGVFNLLVVVFLIIALLMGILALHRLYYSEDERAFKKKDKQKSDRELNEEEDYEEPSEYVVEEGEAEPDDLWEESSQIEAEDKDW